MGYLWKPHFAAAWPVVVVVAQSAVEVVESVTPRPLMAALFEEQDEIGHLEVPRRLADLRST